MHMLGIQTEGRQAGSTRGPRRECWQCTVETETGSTEGRLLLTGPPLQPDGRLLWDLNWSFDVTGRGGEGEENGICPSLLALYYMALCSVCESQPFPFAYFAVMLLRLFSLMHFVSFLSVSLSFFQHVVLLSVCIPDIASKFPLFSFSKADCHTEMTTTCHRGSLRIYYLFAIYVAYVCLHARVHIKAV